MGTIRNLSCFVSMFAVVLFAVCFAGCSISNAREFSVGSGDDDWWTAYPDQSPSAGKEVDHPDWVLDALLEKPVLIYVHLGCSYCTPQTDAVAEVVNDSEDMFTYFDLSPQESDADDSRTEEDDSSSAEENVLHAQEALLTYDPNEVPNYVPMTIIVTFAPGPDGNVEPVWHSTEEVTGIEWIKSYVEDAIDYYDEYSESWEM